MTASQPTSPTTPSKKRRSSRLSSFDVPQDASPSPYTSGTTSGTSATNFSRRSSRTSQTSYQPQSPVTPRPTSSRSKRHSLRRRRSSRASINSISSFREQSNGLGNLADELNQVWDEQDPEQQGSSFLDGLREGDSVTQIQSPCDINDMHDFGFSNTSVHSHLPQDTGSTLQVPNSPQKPIKPQPQRRKSTHQRTESAYDGSDYGSEHDEDELSAFPPLLRKRLREIERLTREFEDADSVSEAGGVVKRMVAGLRDLGPPQSNIEYGLTKLATAYTSMATHRIHKQREIFALSHSLLYGSTCAELPDEFLDLLISEINELSSTIPFLQAQNPLLSLQILAAHTSDLTHTLRSLTDLLQENRLAANAATRKLKSVKDMVDGMQIEEELVENSIMLIQLGDWDRRCRERQAGKMCREIASGFGARWGIEMGSLAEVRC